MRNTGLVDLEIRQATDYEGRFTSPIATEDWDAKAHTEVSGDTVYIFSQLPANRDIVVRADAKPGYKLLDLDRIDTYRNMEENGVEGSAFGDMGGFGHTVTLCPLTETEPTGQDFGKCGAFAVVELHDVSALVWRETAAIDPAGTGFTVKNPVPAPAGTVISLNPVENKNLAGVGQSFEIKKQLMLDFGDMAAGAYDLDLPEGWRVRIPADTDSLGEHSPKGATGDLGNALSPLADSVALDITPSTAIVYGYVRSTDGFGLAGINVSANGVETTTDDLGRYVATDVKDSRGKIKVTTSLEGFPSVSEDTTFTANTATQVNITRSGGNNTVAITGTVTESGTGTLLKGVEIKVDGEAPLNAASNGKLVTGDDGTYTAIVAVQPNNDPLVMVEPSKDGYHFIPEETPVAALAGANPSADFTGYPATEIIGRVTAPGGGAPRAEVTVTAYDRDNRKLDDATTTETGTFSLHVPTLSGTVFLRAEPRSDFEPSDPNYTNLRNALRYTWFDPPANRPGGAITVIPGTTPEFGTFTGYSVQPRITSVRRMTVALDTLSVAPGSTDNAQLGTGFRLVKGEPMDTIVVTWAYDTRNLSDDATNASYSAGNAATFAFVGVTTGAGTTRHTGGGGTVQGADAERSTANAAAGTSMTHRRTTMYGIAATELANYGKLNVRVSLAVNDTTTASGTTVTATSAAKVLAEVAHGATGLDADREVTVVPGGRDTHMLSAAWSGKGSPGLQHRIALRVKVEDDGPTGEKWEWVVFPAASPAQPTISRATAIPGEAGPGHGKWSMAEFDINLTDNAGTADVWQDDDDAALLYTVTLENLRDASHIRVDTRVTGAGDWDKGTPDEIPGG